MKKITIILLIQLFCITIYSQWDLSSDLRLYRTNNSEQIILKTSRTDNTQEGLFSSDGWGNFKMNRGLMLGGYLSFYGDKQRTIIQTSRTDDSQKGYISTDGWGSFLFSRNISVNGYIKSSEKGFNLNSRGGLSLVDGYQQFQQIDKGWTWVSVTSEKMRLTTDGKLGIGTTSPSTKLDVNGNIKAHEIEVTLAAMHDLQLNGTLAANNITYTANGNTADYVFEPNYQLKDLSEVEAFIKSNKHLPEIPSAAEMEEAGVNLAEMNKLLLMKVEELTLYSIELEKKVEEEREERRAMRGENEKKVSGLELKVEELSKDRRRVTELEERLAKLEALLSE